MKTALYRHFDTAGRLLYVGISLSAVQRLAQHRQTAHWFQELARVDVEWHSSRSKARAAEIHAISTEAPLCNRWRPQGTPIPVAQPLPVKPWGYAVLHMASGRRDGNYVDKRQGMEMLDWWRRQFPREQFEMVEALAPARPELRPFNASEWRRAA